MAGEVADCEFKISYDDFVMIWMGAGVGYFVIGYLIAQCCHNWRRPQEEALIALPAVAV